MLILAGLLLLSGRKLTLHTVLSYTPSSPFRAAAALLLMYALKSLSIVFPILALFAAGGFLFPWQVAIPLNLFGLSIALTLPYLIGRWAGMMGRVSINSSVFISAPPQPIRLRIRPPAMTEAI